MHKALIVDDHEANLYLMRSLLTSSGYEVVTARDGRAALEQALIEPPDIVITDILMPVMDGFELCRRWRREARLKHIPFVFYTATYKDPQDERFAMSLGADLFLVKPMESDELVRRIGEVVDLHQRGVLERCPPDGVDEVAYLKEYNWTLVRKLEDKVAEVEAANRALLVKEFAIESAPSGIVLTDLANRITYANKAMAELFGRSREMLIGPDLSGLFQAGPELDGALLLVERCGAWAGELITTDGNNERRLVSVAVHTVRDPAGRPMCRMISFEDVTDHKRMIEEVQRNQRLASLSLFAAGVAHDFNNLLTGLFGRIQMARSMLAADHPAVPHLERAAVAFERASDLTRRLLTFAKGSPPRRREHGARELLLDCCSLALVGSNVRYELQSEPALRPLLGDANQLSQVFTNILVNARQAMPQGGCVHVAMENCDAPAPLAAGLPPGRYVRISVTDEGPGIPAAVLPRIFDPLFTTKTGGSGLGLAMCYAIIEAHGGRIAADSKPGHGAAFEIILPAGSGDAAEGAPAEAAAPAPGRQNARVLVMDDEPLVRDIASHMLQQGGYEVVTSAHGVEALEQCAIAKRAGRPIDIAILDVTVPGAMGGHETARLLRDRYPLVAVVFSSGYGSGEALKSDLRPAALLPKPYHMHELLACVRAVAHRREPPGPE